QIAMRLAEAAVKLGRWDVAVRCWEAIRVNFPDEQSAYLGEADALRRMRRFAEANEAVQLGLRRFPGSEALRIERVRLPVAEGDWSEAVCRWRELATSCLTATNEFRGQRAELRKQVALSHPGFDPNSVDLNRWLTGTILSEDPLIILSAGLAFDVIEAT